MSKLLGLTFVSFLSLNISPAMTSVAHAQQPLYIAYPPKNHQTTDHQQHDKPQQMASMHLIF